MASALLPGWVTNSTPSTMSRAALSSSSQRGAGACRAKASTTSMTPRTISQTPRNQARMVPADTGRKIAKTAATRASTPISPERRSGPCPGRGGRPATSDEIPSSSAQTPHSTTITTSVGSGHTMATMPNSTATTPRSDQHLPAGDQPVLLHAFSLRYGPPPPARRAVGSPDASVPPCRLSALDTRCARSAACSSARQRRPQGRSPWACIPANRKPSTGMAWLLLVLLNPAVGLIALRAVRLAATRPPPAGAGRTWPRRRSRSAPTQMPDVGARPATLPVVRRTPRSRSTTRWGRCPWWAATPSSCSRTTTARSRP